MDDGRHDMEEQTPCSPTEALLGVIARLRGEGGCPWDRKQTLESLKPFIIEECCELLDAIDAGDPQGHRDELGDVLLQVLLQSQIRAEEGVFGFEDVADHLREKLIRRHPHVFGSVTADTPDDVIRNWNAIKVEERQHALPTRTLEGLPSLLPALQRAQRLQVKAARHGFDWDETAPVLDKIQEEVEEVRESIADGDAAGIKEELGDLLFAMVNLCRFLQVEAEDALRGACVKFSRRFHAMEDLLATEGVALQDCDLPRMDRIWGLVKAAEKRSHT